MLRCDETSSFMVHTRGFCRIGILSLETTHSLPVFYMWFYMGGVPCPSFFRFGSCFSETSRHSPKGSYLSYKECSISKSQVGFGHFGSIPELQKNTLNMRQLVMSRQKKGSQNVGNGSVWKVKAEVLKGHITEISSVSINQHVCSRLKKKCFLCRNVESS